MRSKARWGAAFTIVCMMGCAQDRVPYSPHELEGSADALWANTSEFWTSKQVPICWENPEAAPQEERDWVRQAVARSWSFAGNLEFTGWEPCAATSTGVRIRLQDDPSGPRVRSFGKSLAGLPGGLILNHTFQQFQITPSTPNFSFAITCTPTSTPAQRRECIENIAIHEFGHVLGFHHEQNAPGASTQPDFPGSCSGLVQSGDTGDSLYNNDWDLVSVMNYCSPAYGGPNLSALDFAGMQFFYGVSPRFVSALIGANVM